MVLSKVIHRTLYYNFSEMKSASKNLLSTQTPKADINPVTVVDLEDGDQINKVCSVIDIKKGSEGSA